MESTSANLSEVASTSKRIAQRLMDIGENRFELLMIEIQQERDRLLLALWLTLGMAVFGLLAGIALTGLIVLLMWQHSPVTALVIVTALYAGIGGILFAKLTQLRRDWQTLPATFAELKKDRECLTNSL